MLKVANFKTTICTIDNLEFIPGKIYAICGKNGSGKTTLAKYLAGYYTDYVGTIEFNNEIKTDIIQEIALLLQNPFHQFVGQTVYDEVTYYFEQLNYDPVKINNLLHQISFAPDQKLSQLSGGMAQKLLIETFIRGTKEVFIFDETFSNLDYESKKQLFSELKKQGKIIIFITNNYFDLAFADNVYELKNKELTLIEPEFKQQRFIDNKADVFLKFTNQTETYCFKKGFNIITGVSGSGKTTLVEEMIGLKPNQHYLEPKKTTFAYVCQYPFMQITTLTMDKSLNNNPRVNELLNLFQLDSSLLTQDIVELSTGELTQLMIIKAIINQKDVLVFDESLEVLDPEKQKLVLDYLSTLDQTIIFITHNPAIYHDYPVWEVKV